MANENRYYIEKSEKELDKYGVWIKACSVDKIIEDDISKSIISKKELIEKNENLENKFSSLENEITLLKKELDDIKSRITQIPVIESKNIFSEFQELNTEFKKMDTTIDEFELPADVGQEFSTDKLSEDSFATDTNSDIKLNEDLFSVDTKSYEIDFKLDNFNNDLSETTFPEDEKLSTEYIDNIDDIEFENNNIENSEPQIKNFEEFDSYNNQEILGDNIEADNLTENHNLTADLLDSPILEDKLIEIEDDSIDFKVDNKKLKEDIEDVFTGKDKALDTEYNHLIDDINNIENFQQTTEPTFDSDKSEFDDIFSFEIDNSKNEDDLIIEKPEIIDEDGDDSIALTNDELLSMMGSVEVKNEKKIESDKKILNEKKLEKSDKKTTKKVAPKKDGNTKTKTVEEVKTVKSPKSKKVSEKDKLKSVMQYLDTLLENLPEKKIKEFANSEVFDDYKQIFEDLGIK